MTTTTFDKLIEPLQEFFEKEGQQIDKASSSRKLTFKLFTLTFLIGYIKKQPSLRKLCDFMKISPDIEPLKIQYTPFSTLKDGFSRFLASHFVRMYKFVIENTEIIRIRSIDELGLISLVDGSIFGTISSMAWAEYKKSKNAIKLHLEFGLNQMIPLEFLGDKANLSERSFLLSILTVGVTYVCDRGYFSFDVAAAIENARAFFIIRLKNNMVYQLGKQLKVSGNIPECLKEVTDQLVRFTNDGHKKVYRIVCFQVADSQFYICTNRFDLTTLQIIMLYAYRWQIELLFKFIKRVLNGIHLFNHSKSGVNIQFCLLMTVAVLYLNMKQFCKISAQSNKKSNLNVKKNQQQNVDKFSNIEDFNTYSGEDPARWVNSIGEVFQSMWKISSYWVHRLGLLIAQPFDSQVIELLSID